MKDSSTATERVGRYQLLEPIGGGPNGMVARAKVYGVAGFERQFAVKRFHADLTVGAIAQALSAAARSYGSLEHPRIARMSEFGVAQGVTFTAVEYVPGLDVFRLLQEAKLAGVAIAAGGALALVSQAARAVGYAHGRGLSHLGLSPTNVIVTADGDVKVTDFGILAATMTQRPTEIPRLLSRVPYMSPEQVSGEATSAATDVFVLGSIAYELVTGQRAFRGDTPAAVAQAILAGPPAEPPLPRPIVRVLQRCLARSPFERFPDARALADALDAALRVAPVPGTRKDVGAQVKTTLERYAQLNEGNVSGMVALGSNIAPPVAAAPPAEAPRTTTRDIPKIPSPITSPGLAPATPTATQTIPGMAAAKKPLSVPSIPRVQSAPAIPAITPTATPTARSPGPPPPPPASSPRPPAPPPTSLTQGWDAVSVPDDIDVLTDESAPTTVPIERVPGPSPDAGPDRATTLDGNRTVLGLAPPVLAPPRATKQPTPHNFETATGEMSTAQLDLLNKRAQLSTSEMPAHRIETSDPLGGGETVTKTHNASSVIAFSDPTTVGDEVSVALHAPDPLLADELPSTTLPGTGPSVPRLATASFDAQIELAGIPAAPAPTPAPAPAFDISPPHEVPAPAPAPAERPALAASPITAPTAPSSRLPLVAGIVLGLGVLGAGGFLAYQHFIAAPAETVAQGSGAGSAGSGSGAVVGSTGSGSAGPGSAVAVAVPPADAAITLDATAVAMADLDAAVLTVDAGELVGDATVASVTLDAAIVPTAVDAAIPIDAAPAANPSTTTTVTATQKSDQLEVTTTPAGARVFLDGAEIGKSPVKTPGSADRHTLAVFLPGHDLYIAEVEGAGVYTVTLEPVKLPKSGPGIKVETCKAKDRYYIYVDGKPSGQTCPTEKRIVTQGLGTHSVEVYDIVTETKKKYEVEIKDDRLSVRVKIDE